MKRLAVSFNSLLCMTFLFLSASHSHAESCVLNPHPLVASATKQVEYQAHPFAAGHRFSLSGAEWELVRQQFSDRTGATFSVIYPVLTAAPRAPELRDYFLSVDIHDTSKGDCNDVGYSESELVHTLPLRESSRSYIRPRAGVLRDDAEHLESNRELVTDLRVRHHGQELLISTGFSTQRRLDLSDCISQSGDSLGIVEDRPGHFEITCFPDDSNADHLSVIDWQVDYGWPADSSGFIDDLIDYVYVESIDIAD